MDFPNIDPIAFSLGPLPIRWYSLAYLAATVFGALFLLHLLKKPVLWGLNKMGPLNNEQLVDVATIAALGAIIGGRTGYVLFYEPHLLVAPWESLGSIIDPQGGSRSILKTVVGWIPIPPALMTWRGGMSFHGGILGVSLAGFLYSRKHQLDPLVLGDLFACAAPIGLFFGRMANFVNGELYGRPADVPWAMVFPAAPDFLPRHPSQLYEAALEGVMMFIIIATLVYAAGILKKKGAAIGLYVAGFGLSRIIVEFFREPDAHLNDLPLGVTMGQILSVPMVLIGSYLIWRAYNRTQSPITEAMPIIEEEKVSAPKTVKTGKASKNHKRK